MIEVWKPVPRWEGLYEVSTAGRVRSLDRRVLCGYGKTALRPGRVLALAAKSNGYLQVTLADGRRRRVELVHLLVTEVFRGPLPPGKQVRHLDGDKTNNALSNIVYGTPKQNAEDRDRHGRTVRGARWYEARL